MVTNFEVEIFLKDLRDEGPEVQEIVKNFLKVLDDSNNPDLEAHRKRLNDLMKRDLEIGKNKNMWALFSSRLGGRSVETGASNQPRKKVDLDLNPP